VSNSNNFYPFSAAPGNPQLAYLAYDLEIEKIDPGIILYPDESNGVITVFREVNGVSWWVVNADYNTDDAQWEQVAPCNAANPAFAVSQDSAGNFMRLVALATIIPGDSVSWNVVATTDLNGYNTLTPNTATSITQIIQNLVDTWNAGTSAAMVARQVTITDTSSAAASLVDNLVVDGTPVWSVRKDGTLVVGQVPYSALVIPNPWTINVPVTFTDPVTMTDGLSVTGGINADNITTTGNETVGGNLTVDGTSTLDGETTAAGGLDVTGGTLASSVPASFTDGLIVTGGETVTGGLTADNLTVTGNETVDGNLNVGGTVTATTFVNTSGPPEASYPIAVTSSFVTPTQLSNVTIAVASTYGLSVGQNINITDLTVSTIMSATVVSINATPTTSVSVLVDWFIEGTPGTTMTTNTLIYPGSGVGYVISLDNSIVVARTGNTVNIESSPTAPPSLGTATGNAAASNVGTTGGGNGPGTIGYTLPGPNTFNYQVVVSCTIATGGLDSADLTVTGGTASGVPITWSVGNYASYINLYYVCTGVGGDVINATNSKGYSCFFQILAFRTS